MEVTANEVRDKLSPIFEKYKGRVVFAYLFGSAAQGSVYPLSDVDIAVFLSEGTRVSYYNAKLSLHADFCRALKRNDIDVVVLNTATNIILLDEIIRSGAVLFDLDTDLREEFELKILHQAMDFKEQRKAVVGI